MGGLTYYLALHSIIILEENFPSSGSTESQKMYSLASVLSNTSSFAPKALLHIDLWILSGRDCIRCEKMIKASDLLLYDVLVGDYNAKG